MRPVAVWLERFRRPAGVPAAASDELDAELMPVFADLERIEEEARALREEAEREAERRVEAAAAEAGRVLAEWRRRAETERARAESERRAALASEARAIEREAEIAAERVRERGLERMPALLAAVVSAVKEGP